MAFEIKQSLRLSQQLVMTPQLQQAIKLLQLNRMELAETINQELMENPILEETMESSESTPEGEEPSVSTSSENQDPEMEQRRDEEASVHTQTAEDQIVQGKDDFNWESYVEEFNAPTSTLPSMRESGEDLPSFENVLTKTTTLEEHLMWQLSMTALSDAEKKLGELIVGNLSDAGYLNVPLEDLSKEAGMELEDAQETLKIIQNFDPLGVAARSLQECLMIQALLLSPRQPLVEKMIENHLGELEKKNYSLIARTLGKPLEQIIEATKLIMEFEPKPGRSFISSDTQYITPDIYVYKVGDEYVVSLNEDGLPKLRISPYYKTILAAASAQQKGGVGAAEGSSEKDAASSGKMTKEYVQEKLRAAIWLIRSIHNRQKTIFKVTETIVKRQRDFFEKGISFLKPMILKDVAADIGMHESTVSRVTTNKYVHTPVGIFELKYFFNSSINASDGGDSLASEAVKEKIRQILQKEDQKNPVSDQKLVELLKKENIDIARRTVAKYREMLGILSSGKRKKTI